MRFYSFLTAENNDKIESSEVEPEPENPKVYIDAPPPKENPWLKNKPQLSEPEGKVSLYFGNTYHHNVCSSCRLQIVTVSLGDQNLFVFLKQNLKRLSKIYINFVLYFS